jgi:hypothetical protein
MEPALELLVKVNDPLLYILLAPTGSGRDLETPDLSLYSFPGQPKQSEKLKN